MNMKIVTDQMIFRTENFDVLLNNVTEEFGVLWYFSTFEYFNIVGKEFEDDDTLMSIRSILVWNIAEHYPEPPFQFYMYAPLTFSLFVLIFMVFTNASSSVIPHPA